MRSRCSTPAPCTACQRAGDGGGELQRLARGEPRPQPLAQVAALEVLHDEPGVLVADAQVVQAHHRGTGDALGDLVLLQEAPEGIERFLALAAAVARHLEHHQRAGALALGQIQVRGRPARQRSDAAVAADEGLAEALRVAAGGTGAPQRPRVRLALLGGGAAPA